MSAEVVPSVANVAQRAALSYLAAGLSVIPIATDGTKAPLLGSWEPYQAAPPKESEVRFWFGQGEFGVAVVCGEVSGHLAVFDFEFAWLFEEWAELVRQEMPGVLERLPQVLTPGKTDGRGVHLYARFPAKAKTCKLAKMSAKEAEETLGDKGATTLIELKAEGGYVLAPGSPAACHPSGRLYELMPGVRIEDVPVLTEDEAENLLSACRALHSGDDVRRQVGTVGRPMTHGERPGESFNRQAGWRDILEPHGWACVRETSGKSYWRRPGKSKGISATTGYCRTDKSGDMLYVFSSNADPFEEGKAYSKFAAHAWLNYAGDYSAAGKSLAAQGFGSRGVAPVYGEDGNGATPTATAAEVVPVAVAPSADDVPPFPTCVFPKAVARYVEEIARSLAGPVDYPAASALVFAASAIGASRCIEVTRTWSEYARIYAAAVGESGSSKSPSMELLQAPLDRLQKHLSAEFKAELEEFELDELRYESDKKDWQVKVKKNGDAGVSRPVKPQRPAETHLHTSNFTVESLIPMLVDSPRGFLITSDEFVGWVTSMNQYKGGKGSDRQFWLSGWNGSSIKVDRKGTRATGSLTVYKPYLSVYGGLVPANLSMLADERGRADGFIERVLFVFPKEMPWSERIAPPSSVEGEQAWSRCVEYLYAMDMVQDGPGVYCGQKVPMSPDGWGVAQDWYADHARERNAPEFNPAMVGFYSKLRAYYFRVALVLHLMRASFGEADPDVIDGDSMASAGLLIDYFKRHAARAYARMRARPEDTAAERLAEWVRRRGGKATTADVVRGGFAAKKTDATALLVDLRDRGYGVTTAVGKAGDPGNVLFTMHEQLRQC